MAKCAESPIGPGSGGTDPAGRRTCVQGNSGPSPTANPAGERSEDVAGAFGARLVQTCESLSEELRRSVGLTLFRLEIERRTTPLIITLRASDPLRIDPRHEWMRSHAPATLERTLRHKDRRIASLRIEDQRRSEYPENAAAAVERILPRYAEELSRLIDEGQL